MGSDTSRTRPDQSEPQPIGSHAFNGEAETSLDQTGETPSENTTADAGELQANPDQLTADAAPDAPESAAGLPDYVTSPNAVFNDKGVEWRFGAVPDYSKTRKVWEETKQMNHAAGSLEEIVENLVKNWEVEASYKSRLSDWRTIDHENYSFAMNGGAPSTGEQMIKTGTYNGIIVANEFYDPKYNDFASSHKSFKRMMPTFAWEVLEVYSAGPPQISFRWRHWGEMKNDYVGFNDKGEKVTAKAHGGAIDIQGVTVAVVDEKLRLQSVRTWMDPLEMFRQIAPGGIVNKQPATTKDGMDESTQSHAPSQQHDFPGSDGLSIAREHNAPEGKHSHEPAPEEIIPKHISKVTGVAADAFVPADAVHQRHDLSTIVPLMENSKGVDNKSPTTTNANPGTKDEDVLTLPAEQSVNFSAQGQVTSDMTQSSTTKNSGGTDETRHADSEARDKIDDHLKQSADDVHPHSKDVEKAIEPSAGQAVAVPASDEETHVTHEEMSRLNPLECPFMMNRE